MKHPTPDTVELWGGTLCLDLANSTDWDPQYEEVEPERNDVLRSPAMLTAWARRLELLDSTSIDAAELARVHDLRSAIHRIFSSIAIGGEPEPADMETLHAVFARAVDPGRLELRDSGWRWTWPSNDPRRVRFACAADAIALLGDAERLPRVTRCPGHGCGWLFLDRTGRRRWCSMAACGSREKMRRMYARRSAA